MRNGHFFVNFDSKFAHMCSENVMVDRVIEKEKVEIKGNSDAGTSLFHLYLTVLDTRVSSLAFSALPHTCLYTVISPMHSRWQS